MPPELLTFIETGVFTRRVQVLGLEGSLQPLQAELLANQRRAMSSREPVGFGRSASPIRHAEKASAAAPESINSGSSTKGGFI